MRRSIVDKDLKSLLVMDILLALRPKNMTVQEVTCSSTGQKLTTYVFNGTEFTHIGSWPPVHVPGFHVPIASAKIHGTNEDVTDKVRRFAGPRHIVTPETLRHALGTWSWTFDLNYGGRLSIKSRPVLIVPSRLPTVVVTDVLGQVSIF
jgi:hypothetical protein